MMKNLKSLLIATVLFLGGSQVATAQAKVAHVDVDELMSKYPAMMDAEKQMQTLSKTYQNDYATSLKEYQEKMKKYESESGTVGDKVNGERQKEMLEMEKNIQQYGQTAQKEIEIKQGDLLKPIQEKVKLAIQKVGKAKGFQYILDSRGLLMADGPNITADIKKELGF
ncbi:MAG: hypothetical protein RLZZ312_92 [Bacteroidota bacterium]|jgi:outer membrane protein